MLRLISPELAPRRAPLAILLTTLAALPLGGCVDELFACKRLSDDLLQVAAGQSCRFRYGQGDVTRYVVQVTRPPVHGTAVGEGEFLRYVAKPGFAGQDRLSIKVERRGVGDVQWQDVTINVTVAGKPQA